MPQYIQSNKILWHYNFPFYKIWRGDDYIVTLMTLYFTADKIWSGYDYVVAFYFHARHNLLWAWVFSDIIFSPLKKSVAAVWWGLGWKYLWHIFSLKICQWVWLYFAIMSSLPPKLILVTPDNIWQLSDNNILYHSSWNFVMQRRDIRFKYMCVKIW